MHMISRVKGTQDYLDLSLFNYVRSAITAHCALYQFIPVETPIIEHTELFKRSLGVETDVVSKEMFLIESRKESDQESSICLRPEATASLVRAFIENDVMQVPWKVFTWGPMFRYERPQKGRYRQFFQVSMEIIGARSLSHDAELLVMLDRFFHDKLLLNNYALLINFIGCQEDRKNYKTVLHDFLQKHEQEICNLCKERMTKNILRVFDCKNETCQQLYKKAPKITDNLCVPCKEEWAALQEQLQLLSVNFTHVSTLVRGLDYYGKTVFEFVSNNLGSQNAFCGGGRYDTLATLLGAKEDQPSIGAAIGIDRLLLLLEPNKDTLLMDKQVPLYVIIPLSEKQHTLALLIADELRAGTIAVELLLDGSVKSMMRKANKLGAQQAILLGDDEQANRQATVKNMMTGEQTTIAQTELVDFLNK